MYLCCGIAAQLSTIQVPPAIMTKVQYNTFHKFRMYKCDNDNQDCDYDDKDDNDEIGHCDDGLIQLEA